MGSISIGRLIFVAAVLSLLIAGAAMMGTQKHQQFDTAAALAQAQAFESKWTAVKGKKDGEIAHYELQSALRYLDQVPPADPRKAEAEAIAARLRADEPAIKKMYDAGVERWAAEDDARRKAAAAKREKENLPARRAYGRIAEKFFLDQGMDVYVTVEGKEARTLRLKYVLMSRPLVHKLSNDGKTLEMWRTLGFQKVILTDGYNSTWSLDLK